MTIHQSCPPLLIGTLCVANRVNNESHINHKDIKYMHQCVFIRSNIMEKHLIYQDDLKLISITFHLNDEVYRVHANLSCITGSGNGLMLYQNKDT